MPTIKLAREAYRNALTRANLTVDDQEVVEKLVGFGARTVNVTIDVDELPTPYLAELLGEAALNANQRAMVAMRVHGVKGSPEEYGRIYDTVVSSRVEFASVFSALGLDSPNCEYFINGRWYPITMGVECQEDEAKLFRSVVVSGTISVGNQDQQIRYSLRAHLFRSETGDPVEKTVRDVLQHVGLRPLMSRPVDYNLKLLAAERQSRDTGRTVWITGPVLLMAEYSWWQSLESRSLGTKESPRKGVIEPELECSEGHRGYYGVDQERSSKLPFVRVFSLDTKRYVYVDVEDIRDYEFDDTALQRLHLPAQMLEILTTVFSAPTELVFGDLIAGKHGGIVILASGNPGVGKTLTAEVYSEMTARPLYVLELGELGTTAEQVEENLNRVFVRVARWDAVLQFDECEIFLSRRGDDLERSAIVGIFLRLLDYYRGILFLTTNRPEVLDNAIISRVALRLAYPDLDEETREQIWTTMFKVAELDDSQCDLNTIAKLPLNGRQIRNIVRLVKIVHKDTPVTTEKLDELVRIAVADFVVTQEESDSGDVGS